MKKTRVEAVDERLREEGYPDCVSSMIVEPLFCFARNFAAEADQLANRIEELETENKTKAARAVKEE